MAEIALGREGGGGVVAAFRRAFGEKLGSVGAVLLISTLVISSSYYVVVVGNVLFTTGYSLLAGFSAETIPGFSNRSWPMAGFNMASPFC